MKLDYRSKIFCQADSRSILQVAEQRGIVEKGASMRLGECECIILRGTKAYVAYQADKVKERHRPRYEFNNLYKKRLEDVGVVFSGYHETFDVVEIAEH